MMPVISQSDFDHLIRVKAIAANGEVLYTVKSNGKTYPPGSEAFSVDKSTTKPEPAKPEPVKPEPTAEAKPEPTKATSKPRTKKEVTNGDS